MPRAFACCICIIHITHRQFLPLFFTQTPILSTAPHKKFNMRTSLILTIHQIFNMLFAFGMDSFFCPDIFINMFYVLWKCVILTTTKKIYWKGNIFAIPSMRAEWGGQWARSWLQQVCSTYICPTPLLIRALPGWERDMGLSSLLPLFPLLTFLALCPHLVLGKADACKISSPPLLSRRSYSAEVHL